MELKLIFRKATTEDLELLVASRMEVLGSVSAGYGEDLHPDTEKNTRVYFREELGKGYEGYFVYDEDELIGCGGICFTSIIPTLENHVGKGAVIVNMYTKPAWRGKGVAYQLLDILVQEAMAHGVDDISLEATPAGTALYKKYGFISNEESMSLPYKKLKERYEE